MKRKLVTQRLYINNGPKWPSKDSFTCGSIFQAKDKTEISKMP